MDNSDWALIISLISFLLALASFVWNIWSKFIYPKPKVLVSASVMSPFGDHVAHMPDCVALHITNFGPADVVITCPVHRQRTGKFLRWITRDKSINLLNAYWDYPNGQYSCSPYPKDFPKKMTAGEQATMYFPTIHEWGKLGAYEIGVNDTFRRCHWVGKADMVDVESRSNTEE